MWIALSVSLTVFALIGALTDVRERRIPNRLVLAGLATALILRAVWGLEPFWHGVGGAGLALAVGFPLFALRAFGGGDVKFLIACGAFVGLPLLWLSALFTAVFGGVLALVVMIGRRVPLVVIMRTWGLAQNAASFGQAGERMTLEDEGALTAPYGVAIAAGCLLAWFGRAGGWLPW
jgi:prepilin peptidase CpaA